MQKRLQFCHTIMGRFSITVVENPHPLYIRLDFKAGVYNNERRAIYGRSSFNTLNKIIRLTCPNPSLSVKYKGKYA